MPHRSTIWRWRKNGRGRRPSQHSGRRLRRPAHEKDTRERLIALIEQATGDASDSVGCWLDDCCQKKPIDLIAVAANDELNLGRRTRKFDSKKLARLLRKEYPKLTKERSESFARSGGEWLRHIDQSAGAEIRWAASERPCCVSKIFPHIRRGMACYWRQNRDYKEIKADLFWLRISGNFQAAASAATRAEIAAERAASKGNIPSTWIEPGLSLRAISSRRRS